MTSENQLSEQQIKRLHTWANEGSQFFANQIYLKKKYVTQTHWERKTTQLSETGCWYCRSCNLTRSWHFPIGGGNLRFQIGQQRSAVSGEKYDKHDKNVTTIMTKKKDKNVTNYHKSIQNQWQQFEQLSNFAIARWTLIHSLRRRGKYSFEFQTPFKNWKIPLIRLVALISSPLPKHFFNFFFGSKQNQAWLYSPGPPTTFLSFT